MRIRLNGQWRELGGEWLPEGAEPSLERVLRGLGFAGAAIATALNGEFVPARSRAQQPVREGDLIEVLSPMQGG